MPDHVDRAPGRRGRFFGGHAGKVVHLDNLSHGAVFPFERLERSVKVQHLHITAAVLRLHFDIRIPRHAAVAPAALGRGTGPGMIDEQLSHDPRRERKQMCAIRKGGRFVAEQADERLVDQCRGLKRVTGPLVSHERACDAAEVDDDGGINSSRASHSPARTRSNSSVISVLIVAYRHPGVRVRQQLPGSTQAGQGDVFHNIRAFSNGRLTARSANAPMSPSVTKFEDASDDGTRSHWPCCCIMKRHTRPGPRDRRRS